MFILVQRTDTLPETRVLVNSDHVVAVLPVTGGGGQKSRLVISIGETWEVALPFNRAIAQFRGEPEMIPPVNPTEQLPGVPRSPTPPVDRRR